MNEKEKLKVMFQLKLKPTAEIVEATEQNFYKKDETSKAIMEMCFDELRSRGIDSTQLNLIIDKWSKLHS